jgi:hypothetical protein
MMMNVDIFRKSCWRPGPVFLLLVCICGCEKQLPTGYGRAVGSEYSNSVNGTFVLQEMVKSLGRSVDRYGKISPRWDQYQTVYWFPDGFSAPPLEAVGKIEEWLTSDSNRTLVFVARDFDAAISYWEQLGQDTHEAQKEQIAREQAHAITGHLSRWDFNQSNDGDWYQMVDHPYQTATAVSGALMEGIDAEKLELFYGSLPKPGDVVSNGSFNCYDAEVLLTGDAEPMVYTLRKAYWPGSRIIVVGNGSFLLNWPLVNDENWKLASRLIQTADRQSSPNNDVLFIESGTEIPISNHDAPEFHSKWSWISHEPMRYIVPNILFWCMLFCFVYFPIFGRPQKFKSRSVANFRDHINALAQLLGKTRFRSQAGSWIDQYRRQSSSSRNVSSGSSSLTETAEKLESKTGTRP